MSIRPLDSAPTRAPIRRVLLPLVLAPLTFLIAIVAFSLVLGADAGGDSAVITQRLSAHVPQLVLTGELLLTGVLGWVMWRDRLRLGDLGFRRVAGDQQPDPKRARLAVDIVLGGAVGIVVAFGYLWWLAPGLEALQRVTGDIVPPGELLPSFRTGLTAFFVADVVLAPLVEESLYRGYALPRLRERWGTAPAVIVSCASFGALHWAGGLWYILATGVVAGGVFAALALRRRSIVAAYAAHLALNVVEFLAVANF
ncbi:MAG: CPBP family intramembrane metalloprotease [Actinobacteria bacterium]|nr:CPBP family intramembrane metalloprotease [Actinomycetota bacterium]MBI3688313.1 CPBP family intramembrane metalloprotease [Actinomycetota bacterium]